MTVVKLKRTLSEDQFNRIFDKKHLKEWNVEMYNISLTDKLTSMDKCVLPVHEVFFFYSFRGIQNDCSLHLSLCCPLVCMNYRLGASF